MTEKYVLPEKRFARISCCNKIIWILFELKKQTSIADKQYQAINKIYEFDKKDDFKRLTDKDKKFNNFNFDKYQNYKN